MQLVPVRKRWLKYALIRINPVHWAPAYIALQTWACVPNTCRVPLMAPAYEKTVCPHTTERWELRTQPFGCQVSSLTALTGIVAIIATLVTIFVLSVLTWASIRARQRLQACSWLASPLFRRREPVEVQNSHGEEDPLLPQR